MKLTPDNTRSGPFSPAGQAAFTLAEIMTAVGLFSLVVIGVVYSQLFGMRMLNITATKLSACGIPQRSFSLLFLA